MNTYQKTGSMLYVAFVMLTVSIAAVRAQQPSIFVLPSAEQEQPELIANSLSIKADAGTIMKRLVFLHTHVVLLHAFDVGPGAFAAPLAYLSGHTTCLCKESI